MCCNNELTLQIQDFIREPTVLIRIFFINLIFPVDILIPNNVLSIYKYIIAILCPKYFCINPAYYLDK